MISSVIAADRLHLRRLERFKAEFRSAIVVISFHMRGRGHAKASNIQISEKPIIYLEFSGRQLIHVVRVENSEFIEGVGVSRDLRERGLVNVWEVSF